RVEPWTHRRNRLLLGLAACADRPAELLGDEGLQLACHRITRGGQASARLEVVDRLGVIGRLAVARKARIARKAPCSTKAAREGSCPGRRRAAREESTEPPQ